MERDFMGLTSQDSLVVVKEETIEGCKEPVFSKSLAVQWPSSHGFEGFNNRQMGDVQGAPVKPRFNTGSNPGNTEPRSKTMRAPVQLTIFYGGMVNVYDDISPEKAQAIMFLAGNGASIAANNTPRPRGQTQGPTPRTPTGEVSQPVNPPPPCPAVSSPMSVSSHPVSHDEAAKTTPRVVSSLGQVMKSAVPQFRKASLARFLEKRKERAMASGPYSLSKSSSDGANPGSNNVVASAAGE